MKLHTEINLMLNTENHQSNIDIFYFIGYLYSLKFVEVVFATSIISLQIITESLIMLCEFLSFTVLFGTHILPNVSSRVLKLPYRLLN